MKKMTKKAAIVLKGGSYGSNVGAAPVDGSPSGELKCTTPGGSSNDGVFVEKNNYWYCVNSKTV